MVEIVTARHVYNSAVDDAARLWDAAKAGEPLDAVVVNTIVSDLAALVARDPVALLAISSSQVRTHSGHDTFTHMVNVSALTMAQAAALRIDGPLLHAFGVAALTHDIGKALTPPEILNKPQRLTPEETAIMRRHVLDGEWILRRTPGITTLAPIVALEHHLREDLSGYPENIEHRMLNVCTLIVTIADVFDAVRSDRPYRRGLAASRVRAIMNEPHHLRFNQPLLTKFVELMGLFPVGSLVRLYSGELAVVTAGQADSPRGPRVKVIANAHGDRLECPLVAETWERDGHSPDARTVAEVIDPEGLGIDPLSYL